MRYSTLLWLKLIWHWCVHFVKRLLLVNPAFRISIGNFWNCCNICLIYALVLFFIVKNKCIM